MLSKEAIVVSFLFTFVFSLVVNILLIFYSKRKAIFLDKTDTGEPQKFHTIPTPRVGGLGIFLSFFLTLLLVDFKFAIFLCIASIPVFMIGVMEDLKRNIPPKIRLIWLIIGAVIALIFFGKEVVVWNIGFLQLPLFIAVPFTIFAIVGFSNAINIIDGFNGLASGVSILIILFLCLTYYEYNDFSYAFYCLLLIAATLGFFVLNFPNGKIFLGDGGAYFLGFVISIFSIFLINRHTEISPWFPFALGIYPVWEVIFSIIRRKWIKRSSLSQSDRVHFHTLVYKRLVRKNFMTSVVVWIFTFPFMLIAYLFKENEPYLVAIVVVFCVFYVFFYRYMVQFKLSKLKNFPRL